jgi:hypothetical protein
LCPDEFAGADDKLRSVISLIRSRFAASNVRTYLDNVGMTGIEIPSADISTHLESMSEFHNTLYNVWPTLIGIGLH